MDKEPNEPSDKAGIVSAVDVGDRRISADGCHHPFVIIAKWLKRFFPDDGHDIVGRFFTTLHRHLGGIDQRLSILFETNQIAHDEHFREFFALECLQHFKLAATRQFSTGRFHHRLPLNAGRPQNGVCHDWLFTRDVDLVSFHRLNTGIEVHINANSR